MTGRLFRSFLRLKIEKQMIESMGELMRSFECSEHLSV